MKREKPSAALVETLELVSQAQNGDRAACEALFERHQRFVCAIVARRLGCSFDDVGERQDVVQEAMLDGFQSLGSFEPRSEGSFQRWLATLVVNRIRQRAREGMALKRGGGSVRPFAFYGTTAIRRSSPEAREPTPSQAAGGNELLGRLDRALGRLSERHARVIELRRLRGLSFEEIARQMSLGGASSARALFARGLSELSRIL